MITEKLGKLLTNVAQTCGYDDTFTVILSNRPELCDYQSDTAFQLEKKYHKAPMMIGTEIVDALKKIENFDEYFKEVSFAAPGFINMTLSDKFIKEKLEDMMNHEKFHLTEPEQVKTFVLDYGGPNVAKPLHVGHMRTAIVGESIKRIINYVGHKTISDVHLGDYGLQIGQVIYGVLKDKKDINDITLEYLEDIYPKMSALCKEDETIKEECAKITKDLQDGKKEYIPIWKKILEVSKGDIKAQYDYLDVHFDYWYGESDSYKYLPRTEKILTPWLKTSEGAKIIEVAEESDKKPLPPLIFKKSNGAYLYASTDIATILQRMEDFHPDHILYVTDNRQEMHFTQVFRVCDKTGICSIKKLEHLGYGTVNGEDGKPYKTRNGDTPKLSALFQNARDIFISKKEDNKTMSIEDVDKIVNAILKFADLQNSREKDYIFDLEKFSEVTGKTGPYILYTYLRLNRIIMAERIPKGFTNEIYNEFDRDLRLQILELPNALQAAYDERKPNYIAEYVYNLCVCANAFYQHNNVNKEENQAKKDDYIYVLKTTTDIIRELLHLLIIEIPTKM